MAEKVMVKKVIGASNGHYYNTDFEDLEIGDLVVVHLPNLSGIMEYKVVKVIDANGPWMNGLNWVVDYVGLDNYKDLLEKEERLKVFWAKIDQRRTGITAKEKKELKEIIG